MKRKGFVIAIALAVLATVGGVLVAEQHEAPSQDEMMATYMKFAAPGEHHEHMNRLAGKWKTAGTFWMEPGAPPMKTEGTAEFTPILGGRFLRQDFHGDFMGSKFTGLGMDGYDNYQKKHIGTWTDSMGTMMMTFEGDCEQGGKVTTMMGGFVDPMTGGTRKMKGVMTMDSDNQMTYVSYDVGADGKSHKTMEIVYTRM